MEDLPGLGPYVARRLAEIGVANEKDLRSMGVVEAYSRLKFRFGREITLNALWGMEAALSGIDWRHLADERKQELKALLAAEQNASLTAGLK
jgi:DNA transformation protein and related proteins